MNKFGHTIINTRREIYNSVKSEMKCSIGSDLKPIKKGRASKKRIKLAKFFDKAMQINKMNDEMWTKKQADRFDSYRREFAWKEENE